MESLDYGIKGNKRNNWNLPDFFDEEEKHWDISYNLGESFWEKGYVTEAMKRVMKYAVEDMQIKEISTTYAKENSASGNVLKKLGFVIEKEVPYVCSGGELTTTGVLCRFTHK